CITARFPNTSRIRSPSFRSLAEFSRSPELARAAAIAVAVVLPLLVAAQLEALGVGIAMAVGVFLSSPADVPGSLRRRLLGILASDRKSTRLNSSHVK